MDLGRLRGRAIRADDGGRGDRVHGASSETIDRSRAAATDRTGPVGRRNCHLEEGGLCVPRREEIGGVFRANFEAVTRRGWCEVVV